ncbi:16S rRNA (guanine(966)-N(2))-methyltransferase RsmD [Limnobacter sp.]|uniref:16S rRNA (guanine(966)-N(2))-methyltransferase RsmD n=1 Tax=Limnobacter sp. TaxID=2003368 RepID=UPI0025BDA8BD|nr:16S rRNA (guanine(966)-N(2))-methyltransferase RsmD [Limnobacter sp.]
MNKQANKLRIIGGAWRRHLLPIAPVEGLRPTPDRVRETVFNWLGQDCTGMQVLDLYAGTGALGFEAASRGASNVVLVEQNRQVVAQLQENKSYLLSKWPAAEGGKPPSIQIEANDVLACLKRLASACKQFDLVALDPPFRSDLMQATLPLIKAVLKPSGLVYAEWHENMLADEAALCKALNVQEIDALRHLKAGQVHAHLFALPAV